MMHEKNLIVPVPLALAQAIANYLVTRPWGDVNDLVTALSQLKPVPEPAPAADNVPARDS